ncbi:MAG: bifunctional oligoribonuclease/PAP phosphatase NrnA [bacterium]|nr:bifunctional oligoribonuclease/PAP phosphatase NrnA [bacterium]
MTTAPTQNSMNWTESVREAAQQAEAAVQSAASILVVTHVSPDGDAIGSLLGTANALRAMGKQVDCAVDKGVPNFVKFLPGSDTIVGRLEHGQWDLMISVDASDEPRTGEVGAYGRANSAKVINLDHHATNTLFGDIHLVVPTAVSATEVVFDWLQAMNFPLTREVALPLLTGLMTDTLGFRTSNVTARTLQIAQHLMEAGASLTEVSEKTLDNRDFQVVTLWKHALTTVELYEGGVVIAQVTQDDIKRAGLLDTTDGGLVQFLIKVNQAMIAAVFKETPEGRVELSFRSKPGFDVSKVAFSLGGGGHKQASGATIDGPLEAARKQVLPLLIQTARQGKLTIA